MAKKQLGFGFDDAANAEPQTGWEVPPVRERATESYEPYPAGKLLERADYVTLIHRTGRTKRVRFGDIVGPRIYVFWPVANEQLTLSVKTGRVVAPKSLREWRLEPNALKMARVKRGFVLLEQKIGVE